MKRTSTFGTLGDSIAVLREMREQLVGQKSKQDSKKAREDIAEEHWPSFNAAALRIVEACENHDLMGLISASREMKNRLRRPGVRRAIAKIAEGMDKGSDEGGERGECACAECGKRVPGSKKPCLDDAMCPDCGLDREDDNEETGEVDPEDNRGNEKPSKEDVGKRLRRRGA